MNRTIGLLSENKELTEDFTSNLTDFTVRTYKSLETLKPDDFTLLATDAEFFDSADTVQFYLSKLRKKLESIPVLLVLRVSMLDSLDLEWFFDEFILFPFRKGELHTRISKTLWGKNLTDSQDILTVGKLRINLKEYSIYLNNQKLDFTYKEFELLRFLVENKGTVFSRKELLNKIWGVESIGGTRTVDVHIRRLRSKLGEEFNTIIETVRNMGYRCME